MSAGFNPNQPYMQQINPEPPKTPADIQADFEKQAKQFRENLPQYKNQMYEGAVSQAKSGLVDSLANIRTNASGRGLLYGGLHQEGDDAARAQAAGGLSQQRMGINQALEGQANQFDEDVLNKALEKYKGDVQAQQQAFNMANQKYGLEQSQRGQLFGGLAQAGGIGAGLLLASDENLKEDIKPEQGEIDELLSSIKPETYNYKNGKFGEGKHMSPMAQDLEKSEIGKSMVMDTPEGKMVDMGKGLGAMLSIQSALDRRLKKLESKRE